MRRKSLTDQRNDTLAGDMPPLTNSEVFNLPIKYMASGDRILAGHIICRGRPLNSFAVSRAANSTDPDQTEPTLFAKTKKI